MALILPGIASASYSLFGIPPKDLSIAQSAYLIGLLRSPFMAIHPTKKMER